MPKMQEVTIRRYARCPWGTYGHLTVSDSTFQCHTVEKPWRDNEPFRSCVPEGSYACLRRDHFLKKGAKYVLIAHDLDVYEHFYEINGDGGRYSCLIHVANKPSEVAGCIGLGTAQAFISGEWAVGRSAATVEHFNSIMPDEFILEIA